MMTDNERLFLQLKAQGVIPAHTGWSEWKDARRRTLDDLIAQLQRDKQDQPLRLWAGIDHAIGVIEQVNQ